MASSTDCAQDKEQKGTKEQSSQTHTSLEQNQPLPNFGDFSTISDPPVQVPTPTANGTDATVPKEVASGWSGLDADGESPEVTTEQGRLGAEGYGDHQYARPDGVFSEVALHNPNAAQGGKRTPLQSSDSTETEYLQQAASELCVNERPRSCSSSLSVSSLSSSLPRSCDKCRVADRLFLCSDSRDFWYTIRSDTCCERVWTDFYEKLKATFPQDPVLRGGKARVMPFMKSLLGVSESLDKVNIQAFLTVIKFIGPFRAEDDRCVVLKQLEDLVQHSLIKDIRDKKKKSCWFAGQLKTEDAENKLKGKPPGTFLIRMSGSESESGSFSLSLVMKDDTISHFLIEGNPSAAINSNPFNLNLTFRDRSFSSLPELVNNFLLTEEISGEDDEEIATRCSRVCPDLPYNQIINGYKK
ncbi:uncharacterized protein [Haliotis cracherodii]|uniref:uncharacterized protein n=1 Tax=Haliotis cracherodii TaxID=6455 RepID=UPI0039ECBA2D